MHVNILEDHILNIIQNNKIQEQSDLQTLLAVRGFDIPQATLSRKLKKLKIVKIDGIYKIIEISQHPLPVVLNIQVSDFGLVVLHTNPGQAGGLAYFLDQKYVIPTINNDSASIGIIGTIAGDDTILLILKNKEVINKVVESIYAIFPYLK